MFLITSPAQRHNADLKLLFSQCWKEKPRRDYNTEHSESLIEHSESLIVHSESLIEHSESLI